MHKLLGIKLEMNKERKALAKRPLLIKLKYIWLFISDLYRNFPVYVIAITILALFQGIPFISLVYT